MAVAAFFFPTPVALALTFTFHAPAPSVPPLAGAALNASEAEDPRAIGVLGFEYWHPTTFEPDMALPAVHPVRDGQAIDVQTLEGRVIFTERTTSALPPGLATVNVKVIGELPR